VLLERVEQRGFRLQEIDPDQVAGRDRIRELVE
jgi:hypothetical protein